MSRPRYAIEPSAAHHRARDVPTGCRVARHDGAVPSTAAANAAPARRVERWSWVVGLALGAVALGPALGSGSLLNLDLITSPEVPVPAGAWGLGPELPRRVPLYLPLAWASSVVGGDLVIKALMLATVSLALVGVVRLLDGVPAPARIGAGALYACSPYLLTRLEVGHLTIALAAALLPWALPTLLDPGRCGSRTLRWAAAMGLAGAQGGVLVLVVVTIGLASRRGRRAGVAAIACTIGQLPWVVPGLVVWRQGASLADAGAFPSTVEGPLDVVGLLAGHGFWQPALQLGWSSDAIVAALAVLVGAIAAAGWSSLPSRWRAPLAAMAVVGLAVTVASTVPVLRDPWRHLTATAGGAAVREGHRLLPLALLPLHLAAGHGAAAAARRWRGVAGDLAGMLPAALALVLAAPALWGLGGALEPVRWPEEWRAARSVVERDAGPVVVLPWHLYLDVSWADGRRLLNPVPLAFGGDVITSSDPELGAAVAERSDPREALVADLVERSASGSSIAGDLAELGVRWVVLMHEVDWEDHRTLLLDPGLETIVDGPTLTLLEVRGWPGAAVGADGTTVGHHPLHAALASLEAGGPVTVHRAGGWGWRRGTTPATTSATGSLSVKAGSGPLWYPPAVAVLLGYGVTIATIGATLTHNKRRSRVARRNGR